MVDDDINQPAPPVALTPEQQAELDHEKERKRYRKGRRAKRDKAGEIKELNITAMMDMMTIILVFLLKSYMTSSAAVTISEDLKIPRSTTQAKPEDAINVTVTLAQVAVNDKAACPVVNGAIPEDYREGSGMMISPVFDALTKEVEKQKYIAKFNPKQPFTGKLNVIADRRVPYHTILEVLYTAGQAELGQYKLMALKND
ncbi:MAG: biopolymer transporter ExbD [Deltaproteobacteria bacterium]|nr:biopolymer transporter ExbD [Deltaproteobacteria bacterium]